MRCQFLRKKGAKYKDINRSRIMPTKHIDDKTWRKIQDLTVKAVIATQKPIKESDVLHYALKKGLEDITIEELKTLGK
jgi:hypothetical protein